MRIAESKVDFQALIDMHISFSGEDIVAFPLVSLFNPSDSGQGKRPKSHMDRESVVIR